MPLCTLDFASVIESQVREIQVDERCTENILPGGNMKGEREQEIVFESKIEFEFSREGNDTIAFSIPVNGNVHFFT